MTSRRLNALFIAAFLDVASCYVIKNQPPIEACAEGCSCTPGDMDRGSAVNVQCGDRNLMSVPITKHDKPVSLLNASFNVLKTLKEDALFSYESVRYLYLQHCKIVNINEKTFQRLENLTEIDLSSNRLISISPNLFNNNQKLDKLILRNNNLGILQWNTPILNGPSSLSFLDLQSCQLSNISSVTFSSLLNLTFLDISRNNLVLLHNDTLASHQKLKDVNLENNPWQCGAVFKELLCWMHSKLVLSHSRTIQCQYRNERWDMWAPENQSSLCGPITTPSKGEFVTVMTAGLSSVSVGVPLSPEISPHTSPVVETALTSEDERRTTPKNEKGGLASLLSWNDNTLTVFVILPITLGGSVFVSLIAVNYITKRFRVHRPQHHIQGEDNHLAACLDSAVPLVNPHLNQPLEYVNRSSENFCRNEYHVYEEIR
jgi:hypothetical protein